MKEKIKRIIEKIKDIFSYIALNVGENEKRIFRYRNRPHCI